MSKQGAAFPFFIALLAALLFGAAAPIGKPLLDHLSAFQLGGLLYLVAAAGVIVLLLREGKSLLAWQMDRKNALRLAGVVLLGGVLGPPALLSGLQLTLAAPGASTGVCTTPRSPRSMRPWPSGIPLSNKAAQKSYPPAGLLSRLSEGLDPLLLAAAAHKAETTPKELDRPTAGH